jgi:hypothetical protein
MRKGLDLERVFTELCSAKICAFHQGHVNAVRQIDGETGQVRSLLRIRHRSTESAFSF